MTNTATAATPAPTQQAAPADGQVTTSAAQGDAAAAGQQQAAQQQGTDAAAANGDIYRPEGLPDHLIGTNERETIDRLAKAYKGARQELSGKGKDIPETPDGYVLQLPDELKGKVLHMDESGKDPVFEAMKPTLHKHGIPLAAVNELLPQMYQAAAELAEKNSLQLPKEGEPGYTDFSFKDLGGTEKAKPVQEAAEAWINGLSTKGLDEKAAGELKLMTKYSEGIHTINALRTMMGEKPIPANIGAGADSGRITQAMLDSRVRDERYFRQGKKDPAFIEETNRMFDDYARQLERERGG